jgi:Skp family chaperone for outer membrane proteins
MKSRSKIFFSLALAVCFAFPTWAQQPSNATAPSAPSSSPGITPIKIAVIETEAFYDPEKGVTRLIRAMESLDREFDPINKELQTLQGRYQSLVDEIGRAAPATDSKVLQEKNFQAEAMRRELKNKADDAEQAFRRRMEEALAPIVEDLQKAVAAYAEQRGIAFVIDLDRARELVLFVSESANITRDFIKQFNLRAPAPPLPVKPSKS